MNDLELRKLAGDLLARAAHGAVHRLEVRSVPLRGGLSARQVLAVAARCRDRTGRGRSATFVVKELDEPAAREAAIHEGLAREGVPLVPRLYAVIREPACTRIVMERVICVARWPWRDTANVERVLRAAADLHTTALTVDTGWDYDAELRVSAASTAEAVQARGSELVDGASERAVRRVVEDLPAIRRALVPRGPFPPVLIHGDLHPGNVVLVRGDEGSRPVFLDWGRARLGSPLEDVASWLQSLGCWEPEVRRRHDLLLAAYLRARGQAGCVTAEVRDAIWLAGACNALAGALRYQLLQAASPAASAGGRASAQWASREWLRIIRRAAAVWGAARGVPVRRTRPRATALDPIASA